MTVSQKKFLKNFKNKDNLIKIIISSCTNVGIHCQQAEADADTQLVQTAIDRSVYGRVNLIAADTGILVMLLHHRDKLSNITYLTSDSKSHDVFQIASTMTDRQKKCILLAHAISGCDTVSYLFGFGKVRIMKILANGTKTQDAVIMNFSQPKLDRELMFETGIQLFEIMFNKQKGPNQTKRKKPTIKLTPLNELRFQAYKYMCAKNNVQQKGYLRQRGL